MLGHIVHFVGNRSPRVDDTLTVDGVAVNLTGATAKLQMRLVGSSTLKVDTAATIDTPAAGTLHYDWAALDVDTAGFYVAWWRITLAGGTIQDSPEFLVEIRAHASTANEYVSASELKDTLAISKGYADANVQLAVEAASRTVDGFCRRSFFLGPAAETRTFTAISPEYVLVDDLASITSVTVSGTAIVLTTDYLREPSNATVLAQPWTVLRSSGAYVFPVDTPGAISILGQFGWATVPAPVKLATTILAGRFLLRPRQAVFGVLGDSLEGGGMYLSTSDPDLAMLLGPYRRSGMIE